MRTAFHAIAVVVALLVTACASTPNQEKHETVFYPALPQQPRVQYLTSITREADLGRSVGFNKAMLDYNKLDRPMDMAHEKGRLYVVDRAYKKIIIADFQEASLEAFPDKREGTMMEPMAIAITDDGYKYVADRGRGQVLVYDKENEYVRAYGERNQYKSITDVAVYGNKVYVCESREHRIVVLDRDSGEVLTKIGKIHQETGQSVVGVGGGSFNTPTHIAVTRNGELLVNDAINMRLQLFDPDHKFVRQIGAPVAGPGGMVRPKGIAVNQDGLVYVADSGLEFVQIFDTATGDALLTIGKGGSGPGETHLTTSVHIDYDNVEAFAKYADPDFKLQYIIYVGSVRTGKVINVYGFGEWIGRPL